MVKILRDFIIKITSFFDRTIRYLMFSAILSLSVSLVLFVGNIFVGVNVSLSFYLIFCVVFSLGLTFLLCAYNFNKLFLPINKPLIMRLEQERVERARKNNRRKNKRNEKKVS